MSLKGIARGISLLVLSSQLAWSQTSGTISGKVADASGAVVAGAMVTVRQVDTGISRTATTDASGRYRVPELAPGAYEVTANSTGFENMIRSGITLTVGREAVVD